MLGKGKNKKTTRMDTLVGPRSEVIGDIKFSGGLHVEGTIKGNVIAENDGRSLVQLTESGTIEGEIRAPFVVLNGVVIGDVHGGEHVELASKARVAGNVYYNLIEMAVGAEVNGKLVHTQVADDVPLALGHVDPLDDLE
ncbi:MAG: polymer-forming cytoskeletal family protein [Gammaproteobacteria bacterium]|nr:polymer-forming cytoskeletal protein [Pseudomonadota bacterium]TDJ20415.1 MAG: polymer-forming cytoskeletal family protein [Gammaproteobacteria bacterium]